MSYDVIIASNVTLFRAHSIVRTETGEQPSVDSIDSHPIIHPCQPNTTDRSLTAKRFAVTASPWPMHLPGPDFVEAAPPPSDDCTLGSVREIFSRLVHHRFPVDLLHGRSGRIGTPGSSLGNKPVIQPSDHQKSSADEKQNPPERHLHLLLCSKLPLWHECSYSCLREIGVWFLPTLTFSSKRALPFQQDPR
jgi:hypothetical protein